MKAKHDLYVWLYYENVRPSSRCDKVNKIMSKAMKKQSLQRCLRFTIQLSYGDNLMFISNTSQNLIVAFVCSENDTFFFHSFVLSLFHFMCVSIGRNEMDFVTRIENVQCVTVYTLYIDSVIANLY